MDIATARMKPNPNILPDIGDPHFHCKSCNTTYSDRHAYRFHLKYVHRMELPTKYIQPLYDPKMKELNKNNPENTSCFLCKLVIGSKLLYTRHIHRHEASGYTNKPLKTLKNRVSRADPNITPDYDDPNGYCKSCNKTYKSRAIYKEHLRKFHIMAKYPKSIPNPEILPEMSDSTNKYCAPYNHVYISRRSYLIHLRHVHHMKSIKKLEVNINLS